MHNMWACQLPIYNLVA